MRINAAASPPWRTSRWTGGSRGCPPRGGAARPPQICAAAPSLVDEGARRARCACCVPTRCRTTSRRWPGGVVTAGSSSRRTARPTWPRSCWPASSRPGACAVTVATISQARTYRAFGVRDFIVANELVDAAALRWVAAELDADPDFTLMCWVDSVAGVRADGGPAGGGGARRPVDVCVEIGMAGGRTGCRDASAVDEVARAAADCPALRLIGVAGYEAALGHDVTPGGGRPASPHTCRSCVRPSSGWPTCSKPTASS